MAERQWRENPCPGALGRHAQDDTVALFWCGLDRGHHGPHEYHDGRTNTPAVRWTDDHHGAWHQIEDDL